MLRWFRLCWRGFRAWLGRPVIKFGFWLSGVNTETEQRPKTPSQLLTEAEVIHDEAALKLTEDNARLEQLKKDNRNAYIARFKQVIES